ncbi:hypothetical protein GN958_ATG18923 [Phytophthora infestans]|uniref:Uncharacterized protein n=1 Tax=Phytophthora infestans TaxID=4787 RepID=A0A8S9TTQ5_PHYIN|nr:hypothetical protein GN958_ATG18923 [Phytophthora infestans]
MTERNKYKCVQSVFSRLTSELTGLPDAKFTAALDHLESWCDNLRQGNVALPLTQSGTSDSELLPTQVAVSEPESHNEGKGSSVHVAETQGITADSMSADPKPEVNLQKRAKKAARKATPKINQFNPRAPKLGRPRKNRAAQDAQRNADRKEYNKGAKLRNALRADDVVHVEEFLKSSQPSLMELSSYLNTFETRHFGRKERNITVTKRTPPEDSVPYRLPEAMVQKALADIERRTPYGEVMDLTDGDAIFVELLCSMRERLKMLLMADG